MRTAICKTCGIEFKYYPSNKRGIYCSNNCRVKDPEYVNPMKGKKRLDLSEYNRINKPLMTGDKNSNWNGGTSGKKYNYLFNDELKNRVRNRDNNKCIICNVPQEELDKKLCVHHIDYNKEHISDVNLISLCPSCHSKTNYNRKYWEAYFKEIQIDNFSKKYGKIAIMINTKDRATELAMLLQSLRTSNYQDFDIFILDESSTNLGNYHFFNCIVSLLRQENHKVFIKGNPMKKGITHARQAIVDWVRTFPFEYEYVARCDDDCILENNYLFELLATLDEGYDLASGVTIPCSPVFKRESKFLNGVINRVVLDKSGNYKQNGDDCGMPYIDKQILPAHHFRSCALYKSEIHNKANYLPTRLSPKGFREEQIFSYRLQLAGYKIGVNTHAINFHQMTPSGGCRFPNPELLVQQDQSIFEEFTKDNKKELKELFK